MGQLEFTRSVVDGWSRIRPDEDLVNLGVMQRLIWCGRVADDILQRFASAAGFRRRGDYEVLALLRRLEPELLTPADVANQLLTSPSGMTGRIDRLEDQELLQRETDPADRRIVRLVLTNKGRSLVDSAFSKSLTLYETMLEEFTPHQREELDRLLSLLLSRVDRLYRLREPWT